MAHAYTPGLKVTAKTKIDKERRLPLQGEVVVKKGEKVKGDTIVAKTALPGNVTTVNVGALLGAQAQDVPELMLKKPGEPIQKDEPIAQSKGLFGLFKSTVPSPINGEIESISPITGQVILREPPQPVEIDAYVDGQVVEIFENEGVKVETEGSLIQGIFGFGRERRGIIKVLTKSREDVLDGKMLTADMKGYLVVGGSLVTAEAIEKAVKLGIKGIVVGGIEDSSIKKVLGYDIGVAITGSESIEVTVIVTEGFGKMPMAPRTFELLKELNGKLASINGATQIRAGVMRPEIIVPGAEVAKVGSKSSLEQGLNIGMQVRIIRAPNFGGIGKVVSLPVDLEKIETESKVRVLEVELEGKKRIRLPRANVEIIEA
ncbi:hypothetical protein GF359_09400 [candidate division WOR-3 bacterium]|uniref:KOW domain-containing protein n=1 Tax=candidate division WOR-3 bacterium TaxID=2052148 RepID=A0A9D5QDA8_UNCW3|nr:hypothetical protein [candidate division WOR-3 bacterium]MBD3365414.1 hypothetical protein [candidate division WOR-3 bacterium]